MTEEKKARRRRRGSLLYTPAALLLILVAVILGVSVFFRISDIEIKGAKKYSVQQIVASSGIKIGDNLVFVDKDAVARNISQNLPYLNDVIIEKVIPDKIIITVTESQPIAAVRVNGEWWVIDQKAKVLEKTDDSDAVKKIEISGIAPTSMIIGQTMSVDPSEKTKLEYLINVLSAIQSTNISGHVSRLDVSNIANINFRYSDRFNVIFGSGDNADYKVVLLTKIIDKLEPDDKGKINLSIDPPRFIPELNEMTEN